MDTSNFTSAQRQSMHQMFNAWRREYKTELKREIVRDAPLGAVVYKVIRIAKINH